MTGGGIGRRRGTISASGHLIAPGPSAPRFPEQLFSALGWTDSLIHPRLGRLGIDREPPSCELLDEFVATIRHRLHRQPARRTRR